MYQLSTDLWEPQARGVRGVLEQWEHGQRPILYSPTGGGKTRQAIELFKWAAFHGLRGVFYVNRRLLISQTSQAFDRAGIVHGVRAADCEDQFDPTAPFQIASADTEASRVINKGWWKLHDADVVVVDEAHLQRTKAMQWILKQYEAAGAKIVLLTATPIDMEAWATSLVVSGRLQEYRDAKALVIAECKGVSLVDLNKVKRNATGEFILDGRKKKIYTQSIVGDVIDYWKRFNPDARPAMAYWPGKAESVWGTQQFEKIGVRWAHVDATDAYFDGERYKLTHSVWSDIIEQYKDGSIKGISSRFKCFDMETELLTMSGWKKFSDLSFNEQVLSWSDLCPNGEYVTPKRWIVNDYCGSMIRIHNSKLDVCVTHDHELLVDRGGCGWERMEAKSIVSSMRSDDSWKLRTSTYDINPGECFTVSDISVLSCMSTLTWCVTTAHGHVLVRRNGKVYASPQCREGIDLPSTYHVILATPIGSLASYIQTVGRALRYSPETPDTVLVTDHGGAYHSHGSPNHDRDWHTLWRLSGHAASTLHRSAIKEGKKPESIVCIKCMTERPFGDTCPSCGHKSSKSKRRVVMESGEIVEHEGKMIRKQARQTRHNTEQLWAKLYWGWKRNHPAKSFRQLEGWFVQKYGYRPSHGLPLMPVKDIDWFAKLRDVPMNQLTGGDRVNKQ